MSGMAEQILENYPDVIMRFDREMRHLYVNPAVMQMVDIPPENFLGKTPRELAFYENDCAFYERTVSEIFTSGVPVEEEFTFLAKHGERVFNWRLIPEFDSCGQVKSVLSVARDITEHRMNERDLRQVFEEMIDGFALHEIICDQDGIPVDYRFLKINPAFEKLTGLKASQIIGKRILEVLPNTEPFWIETYGDVAITGRKAHFEHFSQEIARHFEVKAYRPAPGQFACIFVDITESKQAVEFLVKSKSQFELALKSADMGTWSIDLVQHRRYFDNQVCALLGIDPQSFGGTEEEFFRAVYPDDRRILHEKIARAIELDELYSPEYRVVWPNGEVRHIKSLGRLRRGEQGEKLSLDGVLWDVTEMVRQAAKSMQIARLASLGEMASGIAHEINNPITGIINYAQLLQNRLPPDDPCKNIANRIIREGDRIAKIVRSLLFIAHPGQAINELISVQECLNVVLSLIAERFIKDGVDFSADVDPGTPPMQIDAQQIEQMILNLINNACYALNERFPERHPDKKLLINIKPYSKLDKKWLQLEFYDQGVGIPLETIDRIFDPFFTTKPAGIGTGLGLGLCYEIVKRHHGTIHVESEYGNFTRVTVVLPILKDNGSKINHNIIGQQGNLLSEIII